MAATQRSARVLVLTAGVAAVSVGLLWVALVLGWLGPDVGRGSGFCEAARDQVVRQPANTFSNAGFVVAGLLVAWHAGRAADPGAVLTRPRAAAYAVLVVLLGPGSAAMHASQTNVGGHLDTTSMYLFASFVAAYALTRTMDWGDGAFALAFVASVVGCELVDAWSATVPVVMSAGNVAFGALLLLTVALETRLARRPDHRMELRWLGAAVGAMAMAFVIWNGAKQGTPFCAPHSLAQGHAAWHLLGAVAAYCLYRLYASERVVGPQTVERSWPCQ